MKKKLFITAEWLVKILIFVFSILYIYKKLEPYYHSGVLYKEIKLLFYVPFFLVTIFVLMILNWSVEAYKWRYIIKKIEDVKFLKAILSVFTGVSISLFTPYRTGEYIGRVLMLNHRNRIESGILTFIGSISQQAITLLVGFIAMMFYVDFNLFLTILFFLLIIFVFVIYYKLHFCISFISRWFKSEKINNYVNIFNTYNNAELSKILFISFVRYLIFSLQYYLILWKYDIRLATDSLYVIPLIFLFTSVIPSFVILDIGIRGSVSIYFIEAIYGNQTGIAVNAFSSSLVLWLINIIIPAIIGTIGVFMIKLTTK